MAENDPNKKAEETKKSLKDINEIVGALDEGFRSLTSRLSDVVDELKDATEEATLFNNIKKDISRNINRIAKANETLLRNEINLSKGQLTSKQILSQIDELKSKEVLLSERIKYLEANKNDLMAEGIDIEKELSSLKEGLLSTTKEVTNQLQRQLELAKAHEAKQAAINKKLGIFGGVIKGIGRIPILKDLVDTESALKAASEATDKTGSGLKGLKSGVANLGSQLKQSLTNPANLLLFFFTQLALAIKANDKATGQLAKDFNLTYSEANRVREELTAIGNLSGDISVNTKALQESMVAIGKSLGSNAMLNEKDLVTFTKLREKAGFTNEELVAMEKLTLATGGNLEDNTKNLLFAAKTTGLNNKVLLNEKDIMRDVAKASNAVKLSLAGNPEALGRAAAQAKALGMNLDQLDKIAGGLLDFESSISAELEAQLLTGKNINLEQARLYAINNDMEGLARELAKNFGTAAEFSKMNRIQQEANAKAVGMTREELAATLTDHEALKGLSGKQAENAKLALAAARARGMSEEEIARQGIDNLMKQQSMQERFNNSIEKLKEIFIGIAEALSPILDTLAGMLEIVGYMMKPLGAIMSWASSFGPVMKTIVGLLIAAGAAALFFNGSLTLGIGVAAALAAIGVGMSYLDSKVKPLQNVNDAKINPQGGLVVSGEKGTYALDKNDTVVAGTNLGKEKTPTVSGDNLSIEELKAIRSILKETLDVNKRIALASTFGSATSMTTVGASELGTALNMNTYKTQ